MKMSYLEGRSRHLNEKGREYALMLKLHERKKVTNRIHKFMVDIELLSNNAENYDVVKRNIDVIQALLDDIAAIVLSLIHI